MGIHLCVWFIFPSKEFPARLSPSLQPLGHSCTLRSSLHYYERVRLPTAFPAMQLRFSLAALQPLLQPCGCRWASPVPWFSLEPRREPLLPEGSTALAIQR